MIFGEVLCCVLRGEHLLPENCGDKVLFAEHLVHEQLEVVNLVIIDTDEDDPIIPQKLPSKE
jgi:hypothetical protein